MFYKQLENGEVVECSLEEWGAAIEQRRVAWDDVGNMQVSTVFLGTDHSFGMCKLPVLWETMIFGLPNEEEYQERYTSRKDALAGHQQAVSLAQSKLKQGER
jgi:hypothetical protein